MKFQSLYEELEFLDIIGPVKHYFNNGAFYIDENDLLIHRKSELSDMSPWIFSHLDEERKCGLWAQIMFSCYNILPRGCQNCWKVTCHPRNLKEAFAVLELQEKTRLGTSSKTGMEEREYTGSLGGWSSFWYAPLGGGLAGARSLFDEVKKAMKERFETPPKLTIKRSCTEIERKFGPSDKWTYPLMMEIKEELINAAYAPITKSRQPSYLVKHIRKYWIQWSAAHGEQVYKEYTNGAILPEMVTYNDSIHSPLDFRPIERSLSNAKPDTNAKDSDRDTGSKCEGCQSSEGSCSGDCHRKPEITLI